MNCVMCTALVFCAFKVSMVLGSIEPKFIFISLLVSTGASMSFNKVSSVLPAPASWSRLPDAKPGGGSQGGRPLSNGMTALVSVFIFHFAMAFRMIFITPSRKFIF